MSGTQASFTGPFPFPHWGLLHDSQLFLCVAWYSHPQSGVPSCVPHFRPSPSMALSLPCSLVLSSPRPKMRADCPGGAYSVPLGPQLPHCLTFPGSPVSPFLNLGEMPSVTLSAPLHHRWVLFEEKLEVGAGRWSAPPPVPTVALPSLQKLCSLMAKGLVLLDCPAQSLLELVGML